MTAEERMAYFQGEKRRQSIYQTPVQEKNTGVIFFKIKFFAAVVLFVVFLSLDYTGYQIKGIGSNEIVKEVTTDLDISKFKEIAL
jgi:hypothetical protein